MRDFRLSSLIVFTFLSIEALAGSPAQDLEARLARAAELMRSHAQMITTRSVSGEVRKELESAGLLATGTISNQAPRVFTAGGARKDDLPEALQHVRSTRDEIRASDYVLGSSMKDGTLPIVIASRKFLLLGLFAFQPNWLVAPAENVSTYIVDSQGKILSQNTRLDQSPSIEMFTNLLRLGPSNEYATLDISGSSYNARQTRFANQKLALIEVHPSENSRGSTRVVGALVLALVISWAALFRTTRRESRSPLFIPRQSLHHDAVAIHGDYLDHRLMGDELFIVAVDADDNPLVSAAARGALTLLFHLCETRKGSPSPSLPLILKSLSHVAKFASAGTDWTTVTAVKINLRTGAGERAVAGRAVSPFQLHAGEVLQVSSGVTLTLRAQQEPSIDLAA